MTEQLEDVEQRPGAPAQQRRDGEGAFRYNFAVPPASLPTSDRPAVFLSYSHKDKRWLEDLRAMLAPLVHNGVVDIWWDGKIKPSQKWREEIDRALASARIGVLLVSSNFLASDFIVQEELPYLIEAAAERKVTLCWVLLSACLYEKTPLGELQAAHDVSRPLDTLGKARRNAVLKSICQRIEEAARSGAAPFGDTSGGPEPPAMVDRDSAEIPDPKLKPARLGGAEVEPGPSRKRLVRRRWLAEAAGLALVALLAVLWILRPPEKVAGERPAMAEKVASERPSVAVLGFRNLKDDRGVDFIEAMLLDWLPDALGAGEKLRLVPGETVERVKRELSLPKAYSFSSETLKRLHLNLEADFLVFGSYYASPGRPVDVHVKVQQAPSGEVVTTFSETDSELSPMIDQLGSRLRAALGVGELSPAEAQGVRASRPNSGTAARFYAEGLEQLRVSDALKARQFFEKAIEADREYPLAYLGLAKALQKLGYDRKATEAAKLAADRSGRLPEVEKLQVKAQYWESARQWDQAIAIYSELEKRFPDELEYGLRLAVLQNMAGQGKAALTTIESLRTLPSGGDPRLDLAEAAAARSQSDFKRQRELAETAEKKSQRQGARLLVAQALLEQGRAYASTARYQKALDAFDRAQQIYAEVGDDAAFARTLGEQGEVFFNQGNKGAALQLHKDALKVFQRLGYRAGEAVQLNRIGATLDLQEKKAQAIAAWEDALEVTHEIDDEQLAANLLYNMVIPLIAQGKLSEARQRCNDALAIFRSTGNRANEEVILGSLAVVLHYQGELARAKKMLEDALDIAREIDDQSGIGYLLKDLAWLLATQGDADQAWQKHQEALALRVQLGEKDTIAESRLAIAGFLLEKEKGDPRQARLLAGQALEQFRAEAQAEKETEARAMLARALTAQGSLAKAREEISLAESLAAKSESFVLHMTVQLAAGQVRSAAGEVAEARRLLAGVRDQARATGFAGLALEARLELGRLEAERGDRAQGRELLAAVEKDARARGFGRVAREARRLLGLASS